MAQIKQVVCLGGGYVALYLARNLRTAIKKKQIHLTIINRDNFVTLHGLIPEMVAGKVEPTTVISSSHRAFDPADFFNAEVENVDWEHQQVIISRSLDGHQFLVPFDHLVIGVGFDDNLKRYPGLAENAFRLRNYHDSFSLRNHIPEMFELAEIETDPEERKRLLTFVVAGGNYAGVEVATELATYGNKLLKREFKHIQQEDIKIILIHAGDHILPELGKRFPKLSAYAENVLRSQGIEIKYNTFLASATPEEAQTSAGEHIPTRTIISCTGSASSVLIDKFNLERDEIGRIKVDANMRVFNKKNVWAGGDCAAVPHPKGGFCPPLALYAMNSGKTIAKNILNLINKKSLVSFSFHSFGDACSLSSHKAVGQFKGIPLKGLFPWLVWRCLMWYYLSTLDRRLRLISDWCITGMVGRDIVNVQTPHKLAISEKFYEKDQVIIKEDDIGLSMYFIKKGEVDVIKGPENKLVATLGEGDHFGEVAVFNKCRRTASVVAKTPVSLLEIKRDAAEALSIGFADIKTHPQNKK
jgi:NADH dehydrogenase